MRSFDIATDADLYVEGYCDSFAQSFPGVDVTDDQRSNYRSSLVHIDATPGLEAFTIDRVDGHPVAFLVLSVQELETGRNLSIDVLYVDPGFRRKGLGRQLVAKAFARAKELEAPVVRLEVSVGNEPALALYRAAGFATTRLQLERSAA